MIATDNPSIWREGFAKLSPTNPPCPGFRAEDWRVIHANAKEFLETRGSEAAGMGWSGLSLFGVHGAVGAANPSACGALMMGADPAEKITTEWISFGRTRYYCDARQHGAVLVWRFGA